MRRIVWLVAVTVVFTVAAVGQSVQADAPWLTVYDEAGRPKWEVRMESLVRTSSGWDGRAVTVQLYHDGVPQLVLRAPLIQADRYGREWRLLADEGESGEPVTGDGEGFVFTCREARWAGGLYLKGLAGDGRGVTLSADEARWAMGDAVHLSRAVVVFGGWELRFDVGRYDLEDDRLVADDVTAVGHGVTLAGSQLTAWPSTGKIQVTEAQLVRTP